MKRVLLSTVFIIMLSCLSHAQWTMQASGFPNESTGAFYISAVSKDIAWISARDGLNAPYISNEFSRTVDGGVTWIPGQVIPGPAHYNISNISAISADTAWAAIYLDSAAQDHHCGIYKTTNGGTAWFQQFAIQDGTTSFANNVHFWNASEGMFHGDIKDGYFEIYTTSDGGTTWTRVPQANINATVQPGADYGLIRVIETVGDSMICFITTNGNIYISHDRGYHWTGNSMGYTMAPNYYYSYVAFHDVNHGLVGYGSSAVTSMSLHETLDGGTTWAVANTTGPVNCFGLEAVPGSPNTYVSTGQNASMMDGKIGLNHIDDASDGTMMVNSGVTYSFDGGHTWKKMVTTDNKHFLAVKFLNDSVAFSGSWNNNAVNDGMYKFTSSLEEADFMASDSMINVGDQVSFSILAGGHSTSTFNWTFDGGTPASSTSRNPVVTYNTKGVFNVTLSVTNTWGNSTKLKSPYIYAGCSVGIEKSPLSAVSVFPNPVNDLLTIQGTVLILNVKICDITGKEVMVRNFNHPQATIQTSGLDAGVYNLIIQLQNETVNRKIIIK